MAYNVKVIVKHDGISDTEKSHRFNEFKQAFVSAVVDYYAVKEKKNIEPK